MKKAYRAMLTTTAALAVLAAPAAVAAAPKKPDRSGLQSRLDGVVAAGAIERRIIWPLGLSGTTLPGTSPRIPGPHPHGYVPRDGEGNLLDYTRMNPSLFGAGGELISTAKDLDTFFAALLGGRLLPGHLLAEMKEPAVEGRRYGLGLAWRTTSCGIPVYGNDGDALTYQSWSYSTVDLRRQVTLVLTPDFDGDVDPAVDALLSEAICP